MTDKNPEIGFKPGALCPLCGKWHVIEYKYKEVDIIVCPTAEKNKIVILTPEIAEQEKERLAGLLKVPL